MTFQEPNPRQPNEKPRREIVGLVPAAGQATRIAPLPCSKELYPIGFRPVNTGPGKRPKVVCHYLLEKMLAAGISKAYIVLREGKWDIPAYLGDGSSLDVHLAYLMMGLPFGVPYTLDQAYPFVRDTIVAFGFPDILFQPDDAFVQLLARQAASNADVALGLFPAESPQKVDMVDLDNEGRVRQIVIRPRQTQLRYTWGIAVWTPAFTQFLHDHVAAYKSSAARQPELSVGDVVQAAIQNNLRVEGVPVSNDPYLDIGTPEDLVKAVKYFTAV
jgi:glucose-1-phosphate thymidylyltransferase